MGERPARNPLSPLGVLSASAALLARAIRDLLVAFGIAVVVGTAVAPWLAPAWSLGQTRNPLVWGGLLLAWLVISAAFKTMVLVILIRHHPVSRGRLPDVGPWTVLNVVLCIVIVLAAVAFLARTLGGIGILLGLLALLICFFAPVLVIDDGRNALDALVGSFYLAGRRILLLALVLAVALLAARVLEALIERAIGALVGAETDLLRMAGAIPLMLADTVVDAVVVVLYFQLAQAPRRG